MSEQVRRKLKVAMQENARLKAKVERLTQAGDAMAEELSACYREEGWEDTIQRWNAAKEGKQSK